MDLAAGPAWAAIYQDIEPRLQSLASYALDHPRLLASILLYLAYVAAFARHATKTVFNRRPPLSPAYILSIAWVTRPLQLLWRVLTFWARVRAPDVYVLGEARCGTTTLCALLRSQLGMLGPFSIWDHPLANDKESFYFVGHIFGIVSPLLYRICLPLKLRRPAVVFEGCASYLCAPWVPMLVRRLHRRRRPPVLVVMLREPVEQNLSWWRLEQAGMAWGSAMGLGDDYSVRGAAYPPPTLREAAALSRSPEVAAQWRESELLGAGNMLPAWATPFPAGQLCAFDAMGRVVDSILRWQAHMPDATFVFVTLDELSSSPRAVLQRIADAVARSGALGGDEELEAKLRAAADAAPATAAPRLNDAPSLAGTPLEPDEATLRELAARYRPSNLRLFELLGRDLGWHDDPRYEYYRERFFFDYKFTVV